MEQSEKEKLELFNFMLEDGIISIDDVRQNMRKKQLEKIVYLHPYDIWQGKDGRWRTYIEDSTKKSKRRMIVKTDRETLLEYLVEFHQKPEKQDDMSNITLEVLYPQWLEYKALHTTASNYISRIERDWKTYYLGTEIVTRPIQDFTKLYLDEWAHGLIKKHSLAKKQYFNCTVIIRQALDYAVDLGILETNPFSLVKIDGRRMFRQEKKKADYTQVYLTNEVNSIFSMAWEDFRENCRLKHRLAPLAILFQFQTGLRLGELCAVRYEDVESEDYIHVQRMYRYETGEVVDHTKTTNGDRQVLLTDAAKELIATARDYQREHGLSSNGYIFSVNDRPLSHYTVNDLYRKYCEKAGIVNKSSHKARKTYISCLIDGQININTIRSMVGHANEKTTLESYCFDRNPESEKAQRIKNALAF